MSDSIDLGKGYSLSSILPAVIGASLLLTGCNEESLGLTAPPETIAVAPSKQSAAPEAPVATNAATKQLSFMGAAISSNNEYNFNINPSDPNTPSWMKDYVGTDWVLDQFKGANLNTAVFHFNYNLDRITDTFSKPNFNTPDLFLGAPSWDTIEAGAVRAVNAGLQPVFYMTVISLPDSWNSLLADKYVPSNPDAFFASYKEQLLTIAGLSEKYDSPYMNIGTELGPVATDSKYLPYWEDIISSVRQVYTGKLTYTSYVDDRNNFNTELDKLTFTHLIDMLGMTVFPQTLDNGELNGTYDQFYNEWKTDIVPGLQSLIDKLDKPVFIGEFGISRIDGAGSTALWGVDNGKALDFQEQAELFDAALRAIHEGLDIEGIVFWGAADNTSLVNGTVDVNNSYTNNWVETPSESIIAKWADIFLPDIQVASGGGGGGNYGYPSIDTPAVIPTKNWYDEFLYGTGPVL